jgi:hypothetical protein
MFPENFNIVQLKMLYRHRFELYGKSDAHQTERGFVWKIVREFVRVDGPLIGTLCSPVWHLCKHKFILDSIPVKNVIEFMQI